MPSYKKTQALRLVLEHAPRLVLLDQAFQNAIPIFFRNGEALAHAVQRL